MAVVRLAVCVCVSLWRIVLAMYIVLTTEIASISGVATEAARRRSARVFAQASRPGAPANAASGLPTSQANGDAGSGPSRAAATISNIAAAGASLWRSPPEPRAARRTTAIPPASAARPATALSQETGRRWTVASRSASVGRIFDARRALTKAAS